MELREWRAGGITSHTQNPSSASPTQLNATIEQTTAATDAKVAIAVAERITMLKRLFTKQ